ncbi:SCO family protein [Reichenbachiella carrageenanivorans]|uniref:SCO family protein n=1 Tax=Reichenbachiella carrageenanivorans TaxID=2979869 RepID=A0ABY6D4R6_9BACT|nr:SCO family protein [Reichenbachiella carrageenanivorans]UXX78845.1 SCO family protein [Reichenbachiella carrageenanivorans]
MIKNTFPSLLLISILLSCSQPYGKNELPVMGRQQIVEKEVNGQIVMDTVDHMIADFAFYDQDSTLISNETFKNKIYIADFFFTSCPTICPKMKKQLLRVYEKFEDTPEVAILSHTIDPKYDNVQVLHDYANALGVNSAKWHFVTGEEKDIYHIGEKSYMVTAGEDSEAPGGYIHSGAFLLIDNQRRIRGVYDGTMENQVDLLLADISVLLKEIRK